MINASVESMRFSLFLSVLTIALLLGSVFMTICTSTFQSALASTQVVGPTKNISNNAGTSEYQKTAVSRSNVYVVWMDNTKSGALRILFSASHDYGATFSPPISLSKNSAGKIPSIVATG